MTQAHTTRAHAKLPPSSAYRWMRCPGSVRKSEGIRETPSVFAAEGSAAHMLAEHCMSRNRDAVAFKGMAVDIRIAAPLAVGHHKPDGQFVFPVDAEMVDGVQTYLDVVTELAERSDEFAIEERMDISGLVPGVFGTGDAIAWRAGPPSRVTIADLKYGKGVAVEVEDNEQLLTYAVGVVQRFHNRGADEVELIVVQPRAPHRAGPVRRWVIDIVTLYEHVMALQRAAAAASRPDAPLVPGEWCKFCKAAATCGALRDRIDQIVGAKRVNGEIMSMSDPTTVPFRDWKLEQIEMNMLKGWLTQREVHAHAAAVRGEMPPGAKLVQKRPVRKWKDESAAVKALQLVGVDDDDIYETSVRSPAQVEKAIPKAERGIIEQLADKVSSGTVLAPLDDPRPAVDAVSAAGFDAVEIEERE